MTVTSTKGNDVIQDDGDINNANRGMKNNLCTEKMISIFSQIFINVRRKKSKMQIY